MADGTYNVAPIGIEITSKLDGMVKGLVKLNADLNKTQKQTEKSTYALQKMAGSISNVGRMIATNFGFGSLQQSLQTITRLFKDSSVAANNLVENYNLFTVASGSNTTQNIIFQEKLNKAFRTNISETYRVQGRFENLASSLGIAREESGLLSTNLTKLTYDLSSLFNITQSLASSKLMSGIVGQTKPLRELGIDVTMQTLQTDLDRLGINAQVAQLTQAEKVLLRYIAIMRQSTNAQGDMARTIETNANQWRIFKAQVEEATMWLGTIFYGVVGKLLPYLNAMAFILRDIFKTISTLAGFNIEDFNFMKTPTTDTELLDEALGDADTTAQKLKKSLLGFDELNMLSSSSASDGLLGKGSYYDDLVKYIESYNNGMDKVNMRANEVKDTIMGWLGLFEDNHGMIIALDDTFADLVLTVGSFVWTELKKFFDGAKLFVDDVAKWLNDNPKWAKALFDLAGVGVAIGASMWLVANPLAAIVIAGVWLVSNYDNFKNWWNALTPTDKLITGLGMLALAIAAVWIATSGGTAAIPLGIGFAALGTAMAGIGIMGSGFLDAGKEFKNQVPTEDTIPNSSNSESQNNYVIPDDRYDFTYANGGFPESGQMFIAREAGAEMVGSIGGRTAVANNSQIVEAVSQGVAIAVSSVIGNGGSTVINMYLDDVMTGQAIINTINRTTKTTGNTVLVG